MSITSITIENFKGIRGPVRVELKPITLLFGPNSAGKSTIVQALHYAREIFERQNLNPDSTLLGGDSIDLGGFESIVHQHDLKLPIRITVDLDLSHEDLPDYKDGYEELEHDAARNTFDEAEQSNIDFFRVASHRVKNAEVAVTVCWSNILGKPIISSYEVSINGTKLAKIISSEDARQITLSELQLMNTAFLSEEEEALWAGLRKKHIDTDNDVDNFLSKLLSLGLTSRIMGVINTDKVNPFLLSIGKEALDIHKQISALPVWGKPLSIDHSFCSPKSTFNEWGFFVKMLSSLIVGPGELVRDHLRNLCYVGPLREVPKRDHKPATSPKESRWANGLAAYDTLLLADNAFIYKVNGWLTQRKRLDSGYSVKVKKYVELETDSPLMLAVKQGCNFDEGADLQSLLALPVKRRVLIKDEAMNIELSPHDIGVGISQVLPIVVAVLHHKTGLVAIEQPELHIHPAFQVAMGDLFIEQVRECLGLFFIIETHSEHLMLRFLRRIRETGEGEAPENRTLAPADLSICFIERGGDGISCLPIRVDEDGDFIDRWPRGFFDERAEELFS